MTRTEPELAVARLVLAEVEACYAEWEQQCKEWGDVEQKRKLDADEDASYRLAEGAREAIAELVGRIQHIIDVERLALATSPRRQVDERQCVMGFAFTRRLRRVTHG